MRIGIFGGSFNPPHLAHLIIAERVREDYSLDRVLWIPSAQPPHKQHLALASAPDRLEMVRLAIADNPAFQVSTIELERGGTSYTIDTVLALKAESPRDEFFLIIGGDSLVDLHRWRDPQQIVAAVPLIVYERNGGEVAVLDLPVERVLRARAPRLEISSTEIRRRCKAGRSIRYLVPPPVAAYIAQHRLYRDEPAPPQ